MVDSENISLILKRFIQPFGDGLLSWQPYTYWND